MGIFGSDYRPIALADLYFRVVHLQNIYARKPPKIARGFPDGLECKETNYMIDWEQVRKRIDEYNSGGYPEDAALHVAFEGPLNCINAPLRVLAANFFLRAGVQMEPAALPAICRAVIADIEKVNQLLNRIRRCQLPASDSDITAISDVAEELLPILSRPKGVTKNHFVFATKFLHWSCPAVFPIADGNAAEVIRRICGTRVLWDSKGYEMVIRFCNSALSELTSEQRDGLCAYDFTTQRDFVGRNSILRVFDKYLYLEGA